MVFRLLILTFAFIAARPASAQTSASHLEAGATFVTTSSGQFHTQDVGAGGWLAWRISPLVGVEGELTYHSDPFGEATLFNSGRVEGLFGATIGPQLGIVRPFASVRPGFVKYRVPDDPIGCIAIFPPPLSCTLASGRTLLAVDLGGGLEVSPTPRTIIRATLSDRMLRYPSAAIDTSGMTHEGSFMGHDARFALGVGFRF
jgi:hypothetical protein